LNILPISDLHFEFQRDHGQAFIESLSVVGVDVLIVAGDMTTHGRGKIAGALSSLAFRFPHVVYVTGNHEYYGPDTRSDVHAEIQSACDSHGNLHWLHHTDTTIEGQRFVGTPLWFQPVDDPRLQNWMSDYHTIPGFREWLPVEFRDGVRFLSEAVTETDVVITHHLPSYHSVHPKYTGQKSNCFFVNDVESIIVDRRPRLWIHGHTHESMDYMLDTTRVVCNPFGYAPHDLNPRFNEELRIEA
jgi:Icc-related predicted phosphoesterase